MKFYFLLLFVLLTTAYLELMQMSHSKTQFHTLLTTPKTEPNISNCFLAINVLSTICTLRKACTLLCYCLKHEFCIERCFSFLCLEKSLHSFQLLTLKKIYLVLYNLTDMQKVQITVLCCFH